MREPLPPVELFDRCLVDGKFDYNEAWHLGQITGPEWSTIFQFRRRRVSMVELAARYMANSEVAKRQGDEVRELRWLVRAEDIFEAYGRPRPGWLAKQIRQEIASIEQMDRQFNDRDFIGPQHPDMWPQSIVRMARRCMKGATIPRGFPALREPAWIDNGADA